MKLSELNMQVRIDKKLFAFSSRTVRLPPFLDAVRAEEAESKTFNVEVNIFHRGECTGKL
eukprot:m.131915 g.131915  ORF g.131915 m.131915 type:complete len:60 (+) comp38054_c0_seq11:572-751(+)